MRSSTISKTTEQGLGSRGRKPFLTLLCLAASLCILQSCKVAPAIVREAYPVTGADASPRTNFDSVNAAALERNGVAVRLTYLDRAELFRLSRLNVASSGASDGLAPVITVFLARVSNQRTDKVTVDLSQAVLVDALSNRLRAYDLASYKESHPSGIEGSDAFYFLFGESYADRPGGKKGPPRTPLYKGTFLKPGETAVAFIAFDQANEFSPLLTLVLPGLEAWDGLKAGPPFDLRFKFLQRLKRREAE